MRDVAFFTLEFESSLIFLSDHQTISKSNSDIDILIGLVEVDTTQPSCTGLDRYFEPWIRSTEGWGWFVYFRDMKRAQPKDLQK